MSRDGQRTRALILERATHVASAKGLDALTIGGLAGQVGLSKGAVANHFPSKIDLQLSTIEAAANVVQFRIGERALTAAPGLPRLRAGR